MVNKQLQQLTKLFHNRLFLVLPILFFLIAGVLVFTNLSKPIIIPQENTQKTTGWKIYENKDYQFSFKYPEGLLSNFQDKSIGDTTTTTLNQIAETKKSFNPKTSDPNAYNVIFQANAWKSKGSLSDFLKKGPLVEIHKIKSREIRVGNYKGIRVSNIDEKSDAYFQYNLIQNGNFIYNFALFTDTPALIGGNQQLLNDIISTVKLTE